MQGEFKLHILSLLPIDFLLFSYEEFFKIPLGVEVFEFCEFFRLFPTT